MTAYTTGHTTGTGGTAPPCGKPLTGSDLDRVVVRRHLTDRLRNRLVNPVVRGLARSPLRFLLDDAVVLLTVRGRRSGREITVPAGYAEQDGELLLVSRTGRRWWRNLLDGAPVRVLLRGREQRGTAQVFTDIGQVTQVLLAMSAAPGHLSGAAQSAWARDAVAIRIRLDDPSPAEDRSPPHR
ncbi:nitroreductase family deazaflavin-dependent oxidoreductase [Planomonospora sp. ID67723]|uniref:nitroreductase/quinone reductase family protein n=1 Tax=Planomonospora sp. ID67723 TaxID=2738134 RepID=UPI0018C43839|nr:nitroreductase/quinone reductase family protein [Planomonospora sp. ID67723]MBG0830121.1 nitroreductase family deazaflavin-dependent oxidoreductase [Planomonospora sp. ID67723]